jgi:hypothetical protein
MISVEVKAPLNSFYVLKEPLEIAGCTISTEKGNMMISTTVEAEAQHTAQNYAEKKMRKAILCWSLSTNEFPDFDPEKMKVVGAVSFTFGAGLASYLKPEMEEELKSTTQLLENADNYGIKCAEYYERGIATRGWLNEAFLNFYKACELIYKKFWKEAETDELRAKFRKSKKRITMNEKMLFMCNKLAITGELLEKASKMTNIRNKQDVGHAELNETLTKENLDDCMLVAKAVVLRYLTSTANIPPLT